MNKNTIELPTFKEIEADLFRNMQEVYADAFRELLQKLDQQIAETRDKSRFQMKDKRSVTIGSLFGNVEFTRNYYFDRHSHEYVFLLDRALQFDGALGLSPLLRESAVELAVKGTSYRQAAESIELLLGYRALSHETIRQHLLEAESIRKDAPSDPKRQVLFVEVDGLFVKRQGARQKGREEKIAAIHEGWKRSGKRVELVGKRHYHHTGKGPFWEGFEAFLMDTYDYSPDRHYLVINGDGAPWITACRDHFKNAFFCIDRFHVARDLRSLFRHHRRYGQVRKKLKAYDTAGLMVELESAVGTMETEKKEEDLRHLIGQLSGYPEALGDYRKWLEEQGVKTDGMRPLGASESTMRVFAKRLKNGRAWSDAGVLAFLETMIAFKDGMDLLTTFGRIAGKPESGLKGQPPRHYVEKLKDSIGEATRKNVPYLQRNGGTPIHQALRALSGF